jgi:TolB-like protein/Tfp pilus assembly protein PilF
MSLFAELQRRNVIRVAITYLVAAWVLVQVMELATDAFAAPEWVLKIFIVLLAIGFVPMVIFSWVYELTPEGLKRESEVTPEESVTAHTAKRLNIAVIVLLGAVVVLYAVDRAHILQQERAPTSQVEPVASVSDATAIDSIAVLPFEDFSPDRGQLHLAEGLADTLLHMLAQVDGLRVSARTSSFSFRGTGADIAEIGRELGVGAVLEGSVQRSGDTLRIIAQLIRVSDQSHLWSKTFDRPTGDIFAVQDEIANAVVAALKPDEASAAQATLAADRTSIEAYEHFVRGDRLWQVRSKEAIEESITEFKAAIATDPGYAPAHAGLAMAYLFANLYGDKTLREVRLLVEQEIEQALALDPSLASAYAARGMLRRNSDDVEGAEAAYRRAIELDPSDALVYVWLSDLITVDPSRWDESRTLMAKAYELDPRNIYVLGRYASGLAGFGDYDAALEIYRRGVALEPDSPRPYSNLAGLHSQFGRYDDSVRASLAQIERSPGSPEPYAAIATAFLYLDDHESAQEWFEKARALNPNLQYWSQWFMRPQDHERLVAEMEAIYSRYPDNYRLGELCSAYLWVGRHADVMEHCRPVVEPFLAGTEARLDLNNLSHALLVGWSARQLGDEATAERLNAEMLRMAAQARSAGIVNWGFEEFVAVLHAIRGEREQMLAQLRRGMEIGLTDSANLKTSPWYQPYQDDPEFQAIVAELEARQARMRNSLRVEGL